ncbi:MAG: aldose epimerase family protein [Verrucomicrobiae bacterium]
MKPPIKSSLLLASCLTLAASAASPDTISVQPFGKTPGGKTVDIYTLRNAKGAEARITNYGGIVVSLKVPDRKGRMEDVVLGYDHLKDYIKANPYFGALIGRYGNRIRKGKFELDGKRCQLAINNAPNALHGGLKGFDKVVWEAKPLASKSGPSLELTYTSKDGEEGYPGNLTVKAVYTLTDKNELRIDFTATTDKPTVVNLTHHSYFNLAGSGDILGHVVTIQADKFTPVDKTLIPTGELRPVKGTPFDFRKQTAIGSRIAKADEQLKFGRGYDHNWVFGKPPGKLAVVAKVHEPTTGRTMEVLTTEPGMQFYSGNFLDGTIVGKGGKIYRFRNGFCMEPQHFPDSPNKPGFPSVVLRPGQTYKNTIIYRFGSK